MNWKDFEIIDKNQDYGITTVSVPTGQGKTHAILEYISRRKNDGRKIWYITNKNNNIPTAELKKLIAKNEQVGGPKKIFEVKSEFNNLIDNFPKTQFPKSFLKEYQPLISKLESSVN